VSAGKRGERDKRAHGAFAHVGRGDSRDRAAQTVADEMYAGAGVVPRNHFRQLRG